jgi:O-Antigen ligase
MFADVALAGVLYILFRQRSSLRIQHQASNIGLLFIPIIIIGIISTWLSYFSDISFFYLIQIVKYFVIFSISGIVLRDNKVKKISFEILFLFALFNGVLICLQKIRGGPLGLPIEHLNYWSELGRFSVEQADVYRPAGTLDDPNLASSILGIIFPVACILGISKNTFHKTLMWSTVAFSSLGLLFAGSRAVWLVLGGISLVGYVLFRRLKTKALLPSVITRKYVIMGVFILLIFLPFFLLRISTLPQAFSTNGSGIYRLRHIAIATNYLMAYPFGIGLHVFQYITPMLYEAKEYSYQIAEPHNIAAQIGSEFGIFGLLLFCYVFFRIIARKYQEVLQYKNHLSLGILLGCLSYLGIACFYPWFLYSPISEIFWMFMGIATHETYNFI